MQNNAQIMERKRVPHRVVEEEEEDAGGVETTRASGPVGRPKKGDPPTHLCSHTPTGVVSRAIYPFLCSILCSPPLSVRLSLWLLSLLLSL